MSWRRELRRELAKIGENHVQVFYYGFFSLFQFYLPVLFRQRVVRRFALEYFEKVAMLRPEKVSVIAHSFGTWVVCQAISRFGLRFETVILCGSVVPEQEKFSGWFEVGFERAKLIVNDIAQKDVWVLFAKLVVPFVGAAGLVGLNVPGANLVERVFDSYRHSSFFTIEHYRTHWLPFLQGSRDKSIIPEARLPSLYEWLLAWARPIKIVVNVLLVGLIYLSVEWTWSAGSAWKMQWDARPLHFSGVTASLHSTSRCSSDVATIVKHATFTLTAPKSIASETFEIVVSLGLRSGTKWSILDVEVIGAGSVSMMQPNTEYWIYRLKPDQSAMFIVCGGTDEPATAGFVDDLRIKLTKAQRS